MNRPDFTSRLRPALLARRATLLRIISGELSLLERTDEPYEEEIFSWQFASENRELTAIDEALQRIRDGSYGKCEECGRSIPLARLQALPLATTCIHCQRRSESTTPAVATRQPVPA